MKTNQHKGLADLCRAFRIAKVLVPGTTTNGRRDVIVCYEDVLNRGFLPETLLSGLYTFIGADIHCWNFFHMAVEARQQALRREYAVFDSDGE